ncbi:MAG: type I-C CRISPR-associated protein Cas8c/Csd1 [Syntrophobacterales bacterium]|nr:type I-C CRISPR-associated protein Cas8c/Csd1 [Syntrophobacterales bacterium]
MSWFSNLVETYEGVLDIVGAADGKGNVLLPPNHMAAKTDICVTLDGNGHFRRAEKSSQTIMIPRTEDSSVRTSGIEPHPLHDQLGYLALNAKKREKYLTQLEKWSDCHPKVTAVYEYILGGTLLNDLQNTGIQTEDKLFVRFRVEISDDFTPDLWKDRSVARAWRNYLADTQSEDNTLCYATGEVARPIYKHPKGINPSVNGAKLISCNDEINYTYKGRFNKPEQANAISADASHKAHAMLKYLISTQRSKCDTQAVVAWAIGDGSTQPDPFKNSKDLYGIYANSNETESDKCIEIHSKLATDYAKKLGAALRGKGSAKNIDNKNMVRLVAVMAVDAATTGRMGITFYQELPENEYIERVITWHESCCWWFRWENRDYISAPSVDRIIAAVYGEPKGTSYKKIQKQAREKLLHCIVCGEPIDRGWVSATVARVSNPFSYDKGGSGWDKSEWEDAVSVTCAVVRKYYSQKKEEFSLELEKERADRDYLFGRLLAVADRLESHARHLQHLQTKGDDDIDKNDTDKCQTNGDDDTDKRPTNAVRYMPAFAAKPVRTWKLIFDQLNPYMQRMNGAEWYQQQIDEIMSLFDQEEFTDSTLSGKYLLGYSLQRRALRLRPKNKKRGRSQ